MFAIDGIDRAEFETLLRAYGKECAREALREAGAVLTPTLDAEEVRDLLGFASVDSVHRRVRDGRLPAKRDGRKFRFLRSDVLAYQQAESGKGESA